MFKIVVIGSSGTGKTNISTRYMRNHFQETSQATLGVEFLTKKYLCGTLPDRRDTRPLAKSTTKVRLALLSSTISRTPKPTSNLSHGCDL